jgi:glycosyltransferase involved in cell wall biosynthesis
MLVSLVVPIYNEGLHLHQFLEQIDSVSLPIDRELIFIDDNSSDNSFEILRNFPFKSNHRIHRCQINQGKGAALRIGFQLSTGDFIGIQDADFEYALDDIPVLLEPLIRGKADIVFGSRFKKSGSQVHRTYHYLINRFLTFFSNFFSGLYLTDMETCYKFFHADLLRNIRLESNRFGFEPEITAKIARLKVRILEVPISYYPRTYLEGKKISWKDGIAALRHIIVFNILRKPNSYILPDMPRKFIPSEKLWL